MTPTEPGFNAANLRNHAVICGRTDSPMMMTPANILALVDEVDRLTDTEKAQGVMIRELERLNTELNDELGTAVQVLKLERDAALAEVERLTASHEHVDGLLAASGHPEDRIRFARLHIEPTLKGISRPLALAVTERELARAERDSLRARLAAVVHAHADYFDMDGRPGFDETEPEPEDVWRYDRDFRGALAKGDAS